MSIRTVVTRRGIDAVDNKLGSGVAPGDFEVQVPAQFNSDVVFQGNIYADNIINSSGSATTRPWTDVRNARIHIVVDSNTQGSGVGNLGAWRMPCYNALRSWRGDFDFVGTVIDVPQELSTFGLWFHDGTSGNEMQN